jgi:hypothetical protein
MQSFLGLEVKQLDGCIKLNLDTYIQELIAEYQLIRPIFFKPKNLPMSPGLLLETNDCPETPDPVAQKQYRSKAAKVQFAAHWIRFDISYAAAQLARFCGSKNIFFRKRTTFSRKKQDFSANSQRCGKALFIRIQFRLSRPRYPGSPCVFFGEPHVDVTQSPRTAS